MARFHQAAGLAACIGILASGAFMANRVASQDGGSEGGSQAVVLKAVSAFDSIVDRKARSIAIFDEAGKVLQHPRCLNCHPADDHPLQTLKMIPHEPPVFRGPDNMGAPGMMCSTCHGPENVTVVAQSAGIQSIPGDPNWHLAPLSMAWVGKSLGAICEQLKDPSRNGGKSLEAIVEHMASDHLVGWGWNPGKGREPAPGSQQQFGDLAKAWLASGAYCPTG
jgi:hypothetical protein